MSDWKEVLSTVAPSMARALGGPLAGYAADAICSTLLGKPVKGADDAQVEAALKGASPETLLALKKADQTFAVQMEKIAAGDRGGARKMAIDTSILPQVILSVIYTGGYFWLMASMVDGTLVVPAEMAGLFNGLLGIMTGAQIKIMDFWFGSSAGSKQKTTQMR